MSLSVPLLVARTEVLFVNLEILWTVLHLISIVKQHERLQIVLSLSLFLLNFLG